MSADRERWSAVDQYIEARLLPADPVLAEAIAASTAGGLPPIAVSPAQGKMLYLLARLHHAARILELGTLGGYSTIWLARALREDGRLITLELDPAYAQVARASIDRAGVGERVEIRVGPALDGMKALIEEGAMPFDLVFIDADKESTPEYFEHALKLTEPGALIVTDNVVRAGALIDEDDQEGRVVGMRRFHDLVQRLTAEGRVTATTIQTVGVKGYDGFTLALVES